MTDFPWLHVASYKRGNHLNHFLLGYEKVYKLFVLVCRHQLPEIALRHLDKMLTLP